MKHRIVFTIENLFPLGPAQTLFQLCQKLIAQQHEVAVAVLGQREFEPVEWRSHGIDVRFLNGDDQTPLHTWRDGFQIIRELRALLANFRPGIVHSWCGVSQWLTLLATEDWPFINNPFEIRLFGTELFLGPEKRFSRQMLENRMSRRVEKMLVPHQSVKRHLVESGFREDRIGVIDNCFCHVSRQQNRVDARKQLHRLLGLNESTHVVGTVAQLHPQSRLKDQIWAIDLLKVLRDDVHLVVFGKGHQLKRLRRFAALTEAKSHIHLVGHPENSEQLLAGIDVYWHSHLRSPVCSNLLTALSMGIPAVSVFGDGTREIIRPQETGFGVNYGARNEFASWTRFLLDRPDDARQLAQQGRHFVRSNYAPEKMAEKYVDIYDLST
ncbi:MAG: glycosyltransferase family 4 protein [Planctomycetota bacterium]